MFYGGVVCASQYGALGGNMVAGETYILLITLYDDWGEVISNPDVVSAACPLLSLDRFSVCLSVLFTPLSSLSSRLFFSVPMRSQTSTPSPTRIGLCHQSVAAV